MTEEGKETEPRFGRLKLIIIIVVVAGIATFVPDYVHGLGVLLKQRRLLAFAFFAFVGLNAVGLVRAITDTFHPDFQQSRRLGFFVGTWLGVMLNLVFEISLYFGVLFSALHIASLFAIFLWLLVILMLGKTLYQGGMPAVQRELSHPFLKWVLVSILPCSLIAWKFVDVDTKYALLWKKFWERSWSFLDSRLKKMGIELRD